MYKHKDKDVARSEDAAAVEITVYTDYVCPYCLLAETILREAMRGKDVRIRWRPFELRPDPVPTLRVEDDYLPTVWLKSVYPLAERLGVPIVLPRISPQPRTDKAFEAFAFAETHGLGHEFSMRVMRAFFQEEKDIGDIDVLVSLAQDIGLKGGEVRRTLLEGTFTRVHREALRHAREEAQVVAVPTIIIGDRRIEGVPRPQQLKDAIAALGPRSRSATSFLPIPPC